MFSCQNGAKTGGHFAAQKRPENKAEIFLISLSEVKEICVRTAFDGRWKLNDDGLLFVRIVLDGDLDVGNVGSRDDADEVADAVDEVKTA